jgi:DNA-binding NarL/FixJ family response regulator
LDRDRQKIMAAGFYGYQAKPIEVTQFVTAVRSAIGSPSTEPLLGRYTRPSAYSRQGLLDSRPLGR